MILNQKVDDKIFESGFLKNDVKRVSEEFRENINCTKGKLSG